MSTIQKLYMGALRKDERERRTTIKTTSHLTYIICKHITNFPSMQPGEESTSTARAGSGLWEHLRFALHRILAHTLCLIDYKAA